MNDDFIVNGLPLPPLLISLLQQGKWQYPGDPVMQRVISVIEDPLHFCSLNQMKSETASASKMHQEPFMFFREVAGSLVSEPVELPWLDIEKMVFIIVNKHPGDDVAVALDYRTSTDDPRIVASEWLTGEGCYWREVTPTFSEFVERLGLM